MGLMEAQAGNSECKVQTRTTYVAGVEKKEAPKEVTVGVPVFVACVERVDLSPCGDIEGVWEQGLQGRLEAG